MRKDPYLISCEKLLSLFCFLTPAFAMAAFQNGDTQNPLVTSCFASTGGATTFFSDLIVWTAKEAGADCWAEVINTSGGSSSNDLRAVRFGWDPGFRVGVDYRMKHDGWDTKLYYTWFYTTGTDHVQSAIGSVHSSFMGNFWVDNTSGSGISGPSYQAANVRWNIHFNVFDWELARRFILSKALAIRPFIGLKGGWIDQGIHSTWINPDLPNSTFPSAVHFQVGKERLTNNFWGIGPQVGAGTQWKLYSGALNTCKLLAEFSGSIMWGHWSFSDHYQNDIGQKVDVKLSSQNSGATMVRSFMGFGWDRCFSEQSYKLSLNLGYEMQFWMDQLQFYSFVGGRLVNELTLQGGTFEFSFAF